MKAVRFWSSPSWSARIGRMLVILFVLVTASAMFFENRIIYFPSKDGIYEANHGFPIQRVTFNSDDGVRLDGAFCPVDHSRGTILWCHGNGGNLSDGFGVPIDRAGHNATFGLPGYNGSHSRFLGSSF